MTRSEGQVFIETHSDNLILRVARHVAAGDIRPDDVKIFFVKDVGGSKTVSRISIDADGSFKPSWPDGFFPQRQAESFALARAAMNKKEQIDSVQLEFKYPEELNANSKRN